MANNSPKYKKGEAFHASNQARKDNPMCKYGHLLVGDNLRMLSNAARQCLACAARRNSEAVAERLRQRTERETWGTVRKPVTPAKKARGWDVEPRVVAVATGPLTEHQQWLAYHGVKKKPVRRQDPAL